MNCHICSQVAGDPFGDLLAQVLGSAEYVRRVPIETFSFAVIPSLGPLSDGHVILCPKTHYRSFASIPASYDHEYQSILKDVRYLLSDVYQQPVHIFEHGTARDGSRVLCSVDHAHMHLLPSSVSVAKALAPYPSCRVPPGLQGLRSAAGIHEYVFYESPQGNRSLLCAHGGQFESQFLRRVFADAIGRSQDWNWRQAMNPAAVEEIFQRIRKKWLEIREAKV